MSARPQVLLINGPNLNLLGQRQPEIYGSATLADHVDRARRRADELGLHVIDVQSNHEGELVERVHAARADCSAIVINAGAFTHSSWAIHDALAAFDGPIIEVHISNPYRREPWRNLSVIAPVATGSICGLGPLGYVFAVEAVAGLLAGST